MPPYPYPYPSYIKNPGVTPSLPQFLTPSHLHSLTLIAYAKKPMVLVGLFVGYGIKSFPFISGVGQQECSAGRARIPATASHIPMQRGFRHDPRRGMLPCLLFAPVVVRRRVEVFFHVSKTAQDRKKSLGLMVCVCSWVRVRVCSALYLHR